MIALGTLWETRVVVNPLQYRSVEYQRGITGTILLCSGHECPAIKRGVEIHPDQYYCAIASFRGKYKPNQTHAVITQQYFKRTRFARSIRFEQPKGVNLRGAVLVFDIWTPEP